MMDRRRFLLTSLAGVLAVPPISSAQVGARTYRLGLLTPGTCSVTSAPTTARALSAVLGEHGYVEGRNLVIAQRCAEGNLDRLAELAASVVQVRADAILALSPVAIQAAKHATTTIPIVMLL